MVFHKCCISKFKSQVRFVGQNKIVCCQEKSDNYEEITEVLEKTICELSIEGDNKDKYMKKLKDEHDAFLKEALEREEDMNALIKKQEDLILELKERLYKLQKASDMCIQKTVKTASTQSITNSKNASTFTGIETNTGTVGIRPNMLQMENGKYQVIENNNFRKRQNLSLNANKQKILILCDTFGRNVNKLLTNRLDPQKFFVETVIKPGANFEQVTQDMENLTSTYTPQDHIFIMAGSNNFNRHNKYPLFKDICYKVKKCASLNITICTVAYRKDSRINKFIFKFNRKLKEFGKKLNNYVPGNISVLEVNNTFNTCLTRSELSNEIAKIVTKKYQSKNLVFVNTSTDLAQTLSASVIDVDNLIPESQNNCRDVISLAEELTQAQDIHDDNNISLNSSNNRQEDDNNFLYPRLSQLSLM